MITMIRYLSTRAVHWTRKSLGPITPWKDAYLVYNQEEVTPSLVEECTVAQCSSFTYMTVTVTVCIHDFHVSHLV